VRDQAGRPRTKPDDGLQRAERAAAFFDLDKTLMAGSSGMQFARVATRHGIVGRRQLARGAVEPLRYRLNGIPVLAARRIGRAVPAASTSAAGV